MGNCIITRKGSTDSNETGFNYVDNNLGIILNPNYWTPSTSYRQYIDNCQLSLTQGQGITAEICCKVIPPARNSRIFELQGLALCLGIEYHNSAYYVDICSNGNWYYEDGRYEERAIMPLNENHTYALVFNIESISVYVDGELLFNTEEGNASDLPTVTAGSKTLYLMCGSDTSRTSSGDFYAFRFYNRVLSNAELIQNHEEDLKLINLLSS